jgi:hypothetical protein
MKGGELLAVAPWLIMKDHPIPDDIRKVRSTSEESGIWSESDAAVGRNEFDTCASSDNS